MGSLGMGFLKPEIKPILFAIDFQGQPIHVRVRPYLEDCLERLSALYEIVVFTAGV
jgi:TFIIF-interacting CTD phosphatase-like protein